MLNINIERVNRNTIILWFCGCMGTSSSPPSRQINYIIKPTNTIIVPCSLCSLFSRLMLNLLPKRVLTACLWPPPRPPPLYFLLPPPLPDIVLIVMRGIERTCQQGVRVGRLVTKMRRVACFACPASLRNQNSAQVGLFFPAHNSNFTHWLVGGKERTSNNQTNDRFKYQNLLM